MIEENNQNQDLDGKLKEISQKVELRLEDLATELENRVAEDEFRTIREEMERLIRDKQLTSNREKLDLKNSEDLEAYCLELDERIKNLEELKTIDEIMAKIQSQFSDIDLRFQEFSGLFEDMNEELKTLAKVNHNVELKVSENISQKLKKFFKKEFQSQINLLLFPFLPPFLQDLLLLLLL